LLLTLVQCVLFVVVVTGDIVTAFVVVVVIVDRRICYCCSVDYCLVRVEQ